MRQEHIEKYRENRSSWLDCSEYLREMLTDKAYSEVLNAMAEIIQASKVSAPSESFHALLKAI